MRASARPQEREAAMEFDALMTRRLDLLVTFPRSFFPTKLSGVLAGMAVTGLLLAGTGARAQVTGSSQTTTDAQGQAQESVTLSAPVSKKKDKVVQSKDTKKAAKREKKIDPLVGKDVGLPDKQLYDKALLATKKGHFDVARLDLQTLLNTYPDSQYQMRAKLAIADSWYKEGGTAALTQAESEYSDFRVFFPNAPEAAEAQMRIGDIYFRQMDKPDRDYTKATHAEEEYRRMLTDYPDSTLVPQAKQRLREVQEALATRESSIAAYYATRMNWPATIARYQTVADTYPQYSHMDDVLIGLGDAYESEARAVRAQHQLPEAPRARLEKIYDDQAEAAYRKVVLEHSAAPHVEDAKDRLAAMNLQIPTPTVEQAQASAALENSRQQYRLQDRARVLVFHSPDVVQAARVGDPLLTDPKPTLAPMVTRELVAQFNGALNPNAAKTNGPAPATTATGGEGAPAPAATTATAPLAFQDVPAADAPASGGGDTGTTTMVPAPSGTSVRSGGGASVGVEIVTPGVSGGAPKTADPNLGFKAVGSEGAAPLPPVEKAGPAPDQINDAVGTKQPAAQTAPANGKKAKVGYDKKDESSSKHKKKKGLDKLNPF